MLACCVHAFHVLPLAFNVVSCLALLRSLSLLLLAVFVVIG